MPAVTVVIPAFNSARYIGQALASIQGQTLRDVEVLLIDDGSTDNTLGEVERFGDSLDLTIVRQANAGPSAARNVGIRKARGRYCAFLDADDILLPECLSAQFALLAADHDVGLALTDVMTFDEGGIIHRARWNFSETSSEAVLERLLLENFVTTSAVMAPKERLIEAGLFNEDRRVAEDYELWLRLAARWKVGLIDRPLVRYRYRLGSLSYDKLNSARCTLDVMDVFWREHPEYQRSHAQVRRRSLAQHLTNAGAAALGAGKRGAALGYVLRSLAHDPGAFATWKWLVKTLVLPSRRAGPRQVAQRSDDPASAGNGLVR